jgi:hypothetical protein
MSLPVGLTLTWFKHYSAANCSQLGKGITIVPTCADISAFPVTSFYTPGLELGLVDHGNMVSYSDNTGG